MGGAAHMRQGLQHIITQAIDCGDLTVHGILLHLGFDFTRILCGHLLVVNIVQIISTTHRSQLELPILKAAEREHSLRALREANGGDWRPSGVAARLGMKRTALQSRMKKLGLSRRALTPISRHLPICQQSCFGTASSLSRKHPLWSRRKTFFSFSDLADLCTVGAWLERGLPMEKA